MNPESILIVGSTGRTGMHIMQQLAGFASNNKPKIFAFCRDAKKIDEKTRALCDGIIQGDARESKDLQRAVDEAKADIVIVAVGNGDNVQRTDIRTASARALVHVLRKPFYKHVNVLVVSSIGAGGSRIIAGFGIGRMIEFHLRHVLEDHDGQEAIFLTAMKDRTTGMIVRPTALTENESTGRTTLFDGSKKCPTMKTDRKDLAEWLVNDALYGNAADQFGSKPIHITCL
jgi:putative NADH-flavin reductase